MSNRRYLDAFQRILRMLLFACYAATAFKCFAQVDEIPNGIYSKLNEGERSFFQGSMQCIVEEKWSTGRDVRRVETAFFLSDRNGLSGAVCATMGVDKSMRSLGDEQLAMLGTDKFDIAFRIANRSYGAMLRGGGSNGYSMQGELRAFGVSQAGDLRIGACEPFAIPHLSLFRPMFGFEMRELIKSPHVSQLDVQVDGSLLKISAAIELEKQESPWLEELSGTWNASLDMDQGRFVSQSYRCESYEAAISTEGIFPEQVTILKRVQSLDGQGKREYKHRTIRYLPNHEHGYDECFLSYYGLPEPPMPSVAGTWLWYTIPIVSLIVSGLGWLILRRR